MEEPISAQVTKAILPVCPIIGVSVGNVSDKKTWRIDFSKEATVEQQLTAQSVLDTFIPAVVVPGPTVDERLSSLESRVNALEAVKIAAINKP